TDELRSSRDTQVGIRGHAGQHRRLKPAGPAGPRARSWSRHGAIRDFGYGARVARSGAHQSPPGAPAVEGVRDADASFSRTKFATYLKFTAMPQSPEEAADVLDALLCLARCHPELVEIKYPLVA